MTDRPVVVPATGFAVAAAGLVIVRPVPVPLPAMLRLTTVIEYAGNA